MNPRFARCTQPHTRASREPVNLVGVPIRCCPGFLAAFARARRLRPRVPLAVWRKVAERAVGPNQWAITARHLCDAAGDEMRAARRPNSNRGGYLQLSVERLGAFLAPRPSLAHQLRHLNGNKLDNRAVNLAWGTAQENIDDRERHGTTARGERVGTAVLTAKEVAAIKRGLVGGASKASLARAFGVSWPCIDHIARGDNWNHVTAED